MEPLASSRGETSKSSRRWSSWERSLALSIAREQGRELVAIEVAGRDVKVDQVPRDGEAYLDTRFAIGDEAVERRRRENLAERSEPRQTAEQEVGERFLFVYRYDGFEAEQREHQLASAVFKHLVAQGRKLRCVVRVVVFRFAVGDTVAARFDEREGGLAVTHARAHFDAVVVAIEIELERTRRRLHELDLRRGVERHRLLEHGQHRRAEQRHVRGGHEELVVS